MGIAIHNEDIKQAQLPHNLFISGLFLFDLLMTPAIIALKIGMIGMLIPLLCSASLVAYLYLRSRNITPPFVAAHWKLAVQRGIWLMLGYAFSATLILLAWLISLNLQDPHMGHILWTALTRIAAVPMLIVVMVTAVMEASAISSASKREAPEKFLTLCSDQDIQNTVKEKR